jgi:hypothetical protein
MNNFVVAIDLDSEITDYKVFLKFSDAKSRFYQAYDHLIGERPAISKNTGEKNWIENVRLYRVEAMSINEAKEKAENNGGEIIEDTEKLLDHLLNL